MFEATAPHVVSSDQRWFCRAGDLSAAAASLIHLSRSDGYSWPSLPDVTTFVAPRCAQCAGTRSTGLVCSAVTASVEPLKPIKDFCFLQLTPGSLTASQLTHTRGLRLIWPSVGIPPGASFTAWFILHPQAQTAGIWKKGSGHFYSKLHLICKRPVTYHIACDTSYIKPCSILGMTEHLLPVWTELLLSPSSTG